MSWVLWPKQDPTLFSQPRYLGGNLEIQSFWQTCLWFHVGLSGDWPPQSWGTHKWVWPQKEALIETEEEMGEGLRTSGGERCEDKVGFQEV